MYQLAQRTITSHIEEVEDHPAPTSQKLSRKKVDTDRDLEPRKNDLGQEHQSAALLEDPAPPKNLDPRKNLAPQKGPAPPRSVINRRKSSEL